MAISATDCICSNFVNGNMWKMIEKRKRITIISFVYVANIQLILLRKGFCTSWGVLFNIIYVHSRPQWMPVVCVVCGM